MGDDSATIFISDDDDDLVVEDEWGEADAPQDTDKYFNIIQLQLRLCYGLLCALPMLAMLIWLAWRRFSDVINQLMDGKLPEPPQSPRSPAARKKQQ